MIISARFAQICGCSLSRLLRTWRQPALSRSAKAGSAAAAAYSSRHRLSKCRGLRPHLGRSPGRSLQVIGAAPKLARAAGGVVHWRGGREATALTADGARSRELSVACLVAPGWLALADARGSRDRHQGAAPRCWLCRRLAGSRRRLVHSNAAGGDKEYWSTEYRISLSRSTGVPDLLRLEYWSTGSPIGRSTATGVRPLTGIGSAPKPHFSGPFFGALWLICAPIPFFLVHYTHTGRCAQGLSAKCFTMQRNSEAINDQTPVLALASQFTGLA